MTNEKAWPSTIEGAHEYIAELEHEIAAMRARDARAQGESGDGLPMTLKESFARIAALEHELAATRRAKAENDERFMTERDAARHVLREIAGSLGIAGTSPDTIMEEFGQRPRINRRGDPPKIDAHAARAMLASIPSRGMRVTVEENDGEWRLMLDGMPICEDGDPGAGDPGNPVVLDPGEALLHASRTDAFRKIIEMDDRMRDMQFELFDMRRAVWKERRSPVSPAPEPLARIAEIVGAKPDDTDHIVAMVHLATRRHAADLDLRETPPTRLDVDTLRMIQGIGGWRGPMAPTVLVRDLSRIDAPLGFARLAMGRFDDARCEFGPAPTDEGHLMELTYRMGGTGELREVWRPWDPSYRWAPIGTGGQVAWTDFERAREELVERTKRDAATRRLMTAE